MAIEIDDYKPVRTDWNGEGLIPVGALDSETGSRMRLVQAVSGVSEAAGDMNRVIATGNRVEFERGLELLGRDLLQDFRQRGDYEHFDRDWDHEFLARLPDYVSTDAYGLDAEETGRAIEQCSLRGKAELQGIARVGMLRRAKSSWEDSLGGAEQTGDFDAVERNLQQGQGVFIPPGQEDEFGEDARRKAGENRYLDEARRQPMETLESLQSGRHPVTGTSGLEDKVGEEAHAWGNKWKAEYGRLLLEAVETQGELDEQYLKAGLDRGLVDPRQADRWRSLRAQKSTGGEKSSPRPGNEARVCEWTRRIDECGGSDEEVAALSMDLLGEELPREDWELLARRFRKSVGVDLSVRARVSRELYRYYRSGTWGVPGERTALGEWKRNQGRMGELVDQYGDQAPEKMLELLDQCRSSQEESWFCFDGQAGRNKNGNK